MHAHLPRVDDAGVVVCGDCGEPLELRCANGHDPLPIGVRADFSIDVAAAPKNGKRARKSSGLCARCHEPIPASGGRPRAVCDACCTPAEMMTRRENRQRMADRRESVAKAATT